MKRILNSPNSYVEEMLELLSKDAATGKGDKVSIMINSLGATPLEELYILYRKVSKELANRGVSVVMPLVGRYATSMEMTGVTFALCTLDGELEELLKAPCDCPYWTVR